MTVCRQNREIKLVSGQITGYLLPADPGPRRVVTPTREDVVQRAAELFATKRYRYFLEALNAAQAELLEEVE